MPIVDYRIVLIVFLAENGDVKNRLKSRGKNFAEMMLDLYHLVVS
jgi:hypothetical protein